MAGVFLLNPPPRRGGKMARTRTRRRGRSAVKRRSTKRRNPRATKASRSRAAKKGARTRKRNSAKRSRTAKKASRTRKRKSPTKRRKTAKRRKTSSKRRRNPAKRKRATKRRATKRRSPAKRRRRATKRRSGGRRRRNPARGLTKLPIIGPLMSGNTLQTIGGIALGATAASLAAKPLMDTLFKTWGAAQKNTWRPVFTVLAGGLISTGLSFVPGMKKWSAGFLVGGGVAALIDVINTYALPAMKLTPPANGGASNGILGPVATPGTAGYGDYVQLPYSGYGTQAQVEAGNFGDYVQLPYSGYGTQAQVEAGSFGNYSMADASTFGPAF